MSKSKRILMGKRDSKALRRATKGARFVVSNPRTERVAAWFGGSLISFYDFAGGLVDNVSAPVFGGPAAVRSKALELLGKGVRDE